MRTQYKAKAFETGQNDNIIRDGVLTTQQAYDMFLRAGLTTKEWLTKTYANTKQPTAEEMESVEKVIEKYKDKTDIQDTINSIEKNIKLAEKQQEEIKKQNEILRRIIEESTQNIDKKIDKKEE